MRAGKRPCAVAGCTPNPTTIMSRYSSGGDCLQECVPVAPACRPEPECVVPECVYRPEPQPWCPPEPECVRRPKPKRVCPPGPPCVKRTTGICPTGPAPMRPAALPTPRRAPRPYPQEAPRGPPPTLRPFPDPPGAPLPREAPAAVTVQRLPGPPPPREAPATMTVRTLPDPPPPGQALPRGAPEVTGEPTIQPDPGTTVTATTGGPTTTTVAAGGSTTVQTLPGGRATLTTDGPATVTTGDGAVTMRQLNSVESTGPLGGPVGQVRTIKLAALPGRQRAVEPVAAGDDLFARLSARAAPDAVAIGCGTCKKCKDPKCPRHCEHPAH